MASRSRVTTTIGLLVSVLCTAAVVWWMLRQEPPTLPSDWRASWLLGSLVITTVTYTLRGWRWHEVMRAASIAHARSDAYRLTPVAYMANNVLPARGGDLLRIGILNTRSGARRREVLGSILAERLLDATALVALFALLTLTHAAKAPAGDRWPYVAVGALGVGAIALAAYLWLRRRGRFERFAEIVRPVARGSRIFSRREGLPLGAASLTIWLLEGLNLLVIARSVDVTLRWPDAMLVIVLASLLAAIPAAPGYAGTFDAGFLVGLGAAGIKGGSAVGLLLLTRLMFFGPITVVGLVILIARYGGLHLKERRRQLEAAERAFDAESKLA